MTPPTERHDDTPDEEAGRRPPATPQVPLEPSGQMREVASWRLTSELVRRFPGAFRVIETHPAGGQYDCLTLLPNDTSRLQRIDLNRVGSVWVHRHNEAWPWRNPWAELVANDDPKDFLDRLCDETPLARPGDIPPTSSATIGYRVVASLLTHAIFGRKHWECRNGCEDTSGYGGGARETLFDRFPGAAERLRVKEPDDLLDQPAYRFWFVLEDDRPVLAFEAMTGIAWTTSGREIDLLAKYRSSNNRIWPVVWDVAGDSLP